MYTYTHTNIYIYIYICLQGVEEINNNQAK